MSNIQHNGYVQLTPKQQQKTLKTHIFFLFYAPFGVEVYDPLSKMAGKIVDGGKIPIYHRFHQFETILLIIIVKIKDVRVFARKGYWVTHQVRDREKERVGDYEECR